MTTDQRIKHRLTVFLSQTFLQLKKRSRTAIITLCDLSLIKLWLVCRWGHLHHHPNVFMFSLYVSVLNVLKTIFQVFQLCFISKLDIHSLSQTIKIYVIPEFLPLVHLSRLNVHSQGCVEVVTCWLMLLVFALLGYFSPVVISRLRGELQLQSGNMDFSFLLLMRRKRSGDARGSRLLS